jgi:SAM-dependent methyltransferase
MDRTSSEPRLAEQISYYRAIAPEYEKHAIHGAWDGEVSEALHRFRPEGSVLELACGPGTWTHQLLRYATAITALDASPEMITRARERVRDDKRVRFLQVDIFGWEPDRRYDVVFFGFWLSHVPPERFESFWALVGACLESDGRVMFVDDAHRTPGELIYGESSSTVRRTLRDGSSYDVVKVPHRPAELERQLARLGWAIEVKQTAEPFFWGSGRRAQNSAGGAIR